MKFGSHSWLATNTKNPQAFHTFRGLTHHTIPWEWNISQNVFKCLKFITSFCRRNATTSLSGKPGITAFPKHPRNISTTGICCRRRKEQPLISPNQLCTVSQGTGEKLEWCHQGGDGKLGIKPTLLSPTDGTMDNCHQPILLQQGLPKTKQVFVPAALGRVKRSCSTLPLSSACAEGAAMVLWLQGHRREVTRTQQSKPSSSLLGLPWCSLPVQRAAPLGSWPASSPVLKWQHCRNNAWALQSPPALSLQPPESQGLKNYYASLVLKLSKNAFAFL